ncbi:TRAP transporter large permease [Planococcus donghaensis]|uniref:TRAP transporter large permease n=1 Tax=Planococcus donghaensis TaxID=414778 RepID=UPI003735565A
MLLFILNILLLLVLLILGTPLPFAFGGAVIFMIIFADLPIITITLWGFNQIISPSLLAVPLFILFGSIVSVSGIADRLLKFANLFIGKIKGAIGAVVVLTSGFLGAISGSSFTGIASVGQIMIPRMILQGYTRGYSTALVSVSSVLGALIPPSVMIIIYGWATGTSVLGSFLATVGPGALLIVLFIVIHMVYTKKFFSTTGIYNENIDDNDLTKQTNYKFLGEANSKGRIFLAAIPSLSLPVVILGGIYGGYFTPTEAAAVASVLGIFIGIALYRELKVKNLVTLLKDSTSSIGSIMAMIFFSLLLAQTYVHMRIPQTLVEVFVDITESKIIVLIIVTLFLLFVGMIVNDTTAIILTAPLLLPLVVTYGVDPIHFASIMAVNLAMGGITPPYASVLYFGMRVGNAKFSEVLKPTLMFIGFGFLPVILLTVFYEPLSMFIPRLFGY